MAIYKFEFREDFADEMVDGIDPPDDQAAYLEAVQTARKIMTEGILEGVDRTGWISRVFDEAGKLVATVKFSDLIERRGSLE